MAQNNLIRPSVLGNINTPPVGPPPPPQPPGDPIQQLANPTHEIRNIIKDLMKEILATDENRIFRDAMHPTQQPMADQIIEDRFRNNLSDMDKVPDVVRSLREFGGNPAEFSSWKKSVERILRIYEPCAGSPRYFGILNVIRNKIVGSADAALESYNTPLNWKAISRCLTMHYADKRDLSTLEYQMTCLIQGRKSVQEYYGEVYSHLSLILNKISCMEISEECMRVLTHTYRDKALDTFVRGLSGDLSRLLGVKEPADLPEALHLCIRLENQNFRAAHANSQQYGLPKRPTLPPPIFEMPYQQRPALPPRKNSNQTFYPHLAHLPQVIPTFTRSSQLPQYQQFPQHRQFPQYQQFTQHQQYPKNLNTQNPNYALQQPPRPNQFNNPPPRPTQPKPPVPMDIDQSLRTKNMNYMNRPTNNFFNGKRPTTPSNQIRQPFKQNRINNIETTDTGIGQQPDEPDEQTFQDYYNQYTAHDNNSLDSLPEENSYEFSDIHFLG